MRRIHLSSQIPASVAGQLEHLRVAIYDEGEKFHVTQDETPLPNHPGTDPEGRVVGHLLGGLPRLAL